MNMKRITVNTLLLVAITHPVGIFAEPLSGKGVMIAKISNGQFVIGRVTNRAPSFQHFTNDAFTITNLDGVSQWLRSNSVARSDLAVAKPTSFNPAATNVMNWSSNETVSIFNVPNQPAKR